MMNPYFKVNDQFNIAIQSYLPDSSHSIVILLPALGVTINSYKKLIGLLNVQGIGVITADYPGNGQNLPRINKSISYNFIDLLEQFIPALINYASQFRQFEHPILIGHSLGAQIATLYALNHLCSVIGIATGNMHYRHWQGKTRFKMLASALTLKTLVNVYGFLPGERIGFGKTEAKGLIEDLVHIMLKGNYDHVIKHDATQPSHVPHLFLHIQHDVWIPINATKSLASFFSQPVIQQIALPEQCVGHPHFSWLKSPEIVVDKILIFMNDQSNINKI